MSPALSFVQSPFGTNDDALPPSTPRTACKQKLGVLWLFSVRLKQIFYGPINSTVKYSLKTVAHSGEIYSELKHKNQFRQARLFLQSNCIPATVFWCHVRTICSFYKNKSQAAYGVRVLPPKRLHGTFFIRLMLFPSSEFFLMDVFFFFLFGNERLTAGSSERSFKARWSLARGAFIPISLVPCWAVS